MYIIYILYKIHNIHDNKDKYTICLNAICSYNTAIDQTESDFLLKYLEERKIRNRKECKNSDTEFSMNEFFITLCGRSKGIEISYVCQF